MLSKKYDVNINLYFISVQADSDKWDILKLGHGLGLKKETPVKYLKIYSFKVTSHKVFFP